MIKSCKTNKIAIIAASVIIVALIFIVAFLIGPKTASKDLANGELNRNSATGTIQEDNIAKNDSKESNSAPKSNKNVNSDQKIEENKNDRNNYDFSYSYNSEDPNSNVFSGLLIYARNNEFYVEYNNNYDFGVFVESIKGVKNGDEGKYWQYYINGVLGDVAADKKILKKDDRVEWRFEMVPF